MKTRIATLMFIIGMLVFSNTFASEPVLASESVRNLIAKKIHKEITYPEFAKYKDAECIVLVKVVISDEGSFKVLQANCINNNLKAHVIKEIESIKDEDFEKYKGQYTLLKLKVKFVS